MPQFVGFESKVKSVEFSGEHKAFGSAGHPVLARPHLRLLPRKLPLVTQSAGVQGPRLLQRSRKGYLFGSAATLTWDRMRNSLVLFEHPKIAICFQFGTVTHEFGHVLGKKLEWFRHKTILKLKRSLPPPLAH